MFLTPFSRSIVRWPLIAALSLLVMSAAGAQEPADHPGVLEPGVADPAPAEPAAPSAGRNTWRYIVIHHSASPGGNAAQFNQLHRKKGWDGLAYHFVIDNGKGGPDGRLEVGDRWWRQKHGAHAGAVHGAQLPGERNGYNEFGIGICLVGNLDKKPPTSAQLRTLARLVARLRTEFDIPEADIVGHRHVRSTACPGRHFPWKKLFALMELPAPQHLHRQAAAPTTDLCPWCIHQSDTAAGLTPAMSTIRAPRGPVPTSAADVPPMLFLNGRQP